ncbi:MAG TPA: TraB/GumN family protein [Chitinophagaceae bacterium]|nr:TraB/GumN family protein [Chitinophagaceae bacterium]
MIKRLLAPLLLLVSLSRTGAQGIHPAGKYPSLLWEITGNGLLKPSYLFGTMHVSSKGVFHLADSFYLDLRRCEVVALETNPESWQEDMSHFEFRSGTGDQAGWSDIDRLPADYLSIHTLEFGPYQKALAQALSSNPAMINNLLYRTYGDNSADFEEDTYLDMYIYQVGKKMGKRVTGVENYGQSMRLMAEAYRDAARDKNRKQRTYGQDNGFSTDKLQDAYRAGNLDLLDSLNRQQSFSDLFDEKFLYRRNSIQANSMDSILRSGSSLFAGVGAAHLPGARGVIELLRRKGYRLRPVSLRGRDDGRQKDLVEKIRVPVMFHPYRSEDGFFQVNLPGRLYRADEDYGLVDQQQYADMANGSYYMVTRVKTNNAVWGHTPSRILATLDSLLYENIPGRILSRKRITRDGYPGLDITNRTRRGDYQRYHLFVTPFEVLIFKMSGNGDYVRRGPEAVSFFNSIRLQPAPAALPGAGWKAYTPSFGGFTVSLPQDPVLSNDGSLLFDAAEPAGGTFYRIVRSEVHNFHFAGADSVDLKLMAESFASSPIIDRELDRHAVLADGYPALDCRFAGKDHTLFLVRFILQGAHYYTLIAHGPRETAPMRFFLESFRLVPFRYPGAQVHSDSLLHYRVLQPVQSGKARERIELPGGSGYPDLEADASGDEDSVAADVQQKAVYRSTVVTGDSTGEEIFVSYYRPGRYRSFGDSSLLDRDTGVTYLGGDSSWVIRSCTHQVLPGNLRIWDYQLTDSGSSRVFRKRDIYQDGSTYSLVTQTDTLSQPSYFVRNFFETFRPENQPPRHPFGAKGRLFFADFFSPDTLVRRRAARNVSDLTLDPADLPDMKRAIRSLNWGDGHYMETKKVFLAKLGELQDTASANLLRTLYGAAQDTVELQYVILDALLRQHTPYAMKTFAAIMAEEPPVLTGTGRGGWADFPASGTWNRYLPDGGEEDGFWGDLYDSLRLSRAVLPELLPLVQLDDYKEPVMKWLATLVDSNLATGSDYAAYAKRFLLEARFALKKQLIAEKRRAIARAGIADRENSRDDQDDAGSGEVIDELGVYASLLLPFFHSDPDVQTLLGRMLQSGDDRLRYRTALQWLGKGLPVPDSLLEEFAASDRYRYLLYRDLNRLGLGNRFPAGYRDARALAKSRLLVLRADDMPDSLVYLDRLATRYLGSQGWVYFFRYKGKKDDASWKIASVGWIPADSSVFPYRENEEESPDESRHLNPSANAFTGFSDTPLDSGSRWQPS